MLRRHISLQKMCSEMAWKADQERNHVCRLEFYTAEEVIVQFIVSLS